MEEKKTRKTLTGTVVSDKMDKTVMVRVERKYADTTFKKIVKRTSKYSVHDEKNECQVGDFVSICQTRPLSKTKRWMFVEVIKKAEIIGRVESK
ncbi:MAG: 30S ribosomal protein S17 [Candidatus Nitrohelix vancouverensis]|uniref:Small ribosomal subunit protein uS17 n=1 Tax=Candidatus Nitrohelix vancouverensis TaxID=2705534 RepID=A0A7T0C0H8_9BACT|nr:MAG: 30S ribosomal protein S17 [Candidatus Nitrohelix vancouverensis]